jgi:RNA polymerase sigma-70 factor (ECF subfamily)
MTTRLATSAAEQAATVSDADLMRALAQGDMGALGQLYDRHHARVRRFVVRATADAEDVDDLVQATFLEATRSAARYDGRPTCSPWLVGIAVHLLGRRRQSFGRLLAALAMLSSRRRPVDPRPALQARTDVDKALARLSEAKRVTVLMAEVEGMSCAEIAAALRIPIGTVWTRLHAARRELRRSLGDEEQP